MVKPGVVEDYSVAEAGVEIEEETVGVDVSRERLRIVEGVTETQVDNVHVAAPQKRVVRLVVFQGGVQGKGFLADTAPDILRLFSDQNYQDIWS